jgi:hypothetical protein
LEEKDMKPRWEMVTCWKFDLATEEDSFEYFNEEAFIPGHIYRIHVSNGAPIIVEFKHFGCGYDHSMTKTYPRVLMCDGAADVHIKNITHIFAYNGDDDEDVPSESTKTADVSGFKDFVVTKHSYHVNERLKGVETLSGLFTDKMQINGELKITGFDRIGEDHVYGMRVKLPTGDEIFIPASDNPLFELNKCDHPSFKDDYTVFIEDESILSWNKDLVAGEFYIAVNKFAEKRPILIRSIHNDKIEHVDCYSRYNRDNCAYFVESIAYEMTIEDAKDYKFIPVKDVQ